jgi:signal transduction histidine kinase
VVRRRDAVLGGVVAVEAIVESVLLAPGAGSSVVAFQLGLTMAAAATIGLWRLNPRRACGLAAAIMSIGVVLEATAVTGAWMAFTFGGLMWACIARPVRDRATVAGPAALLLAVTVSQWVFFFRDNTPITLVVMAVALATGAAFRLGERIRAAAESDAAEREHALAEAASAAVRSGRLAVARELHDAISGTIGVIVLQAGAAEMLWLQDPARARAALDVVATATHDAQRELDELLPRLSAPDRPAPAFAAHDIEALPELADRMRRGGVRVATHLEGPVGEVPPPVALTTYRIVQECLGNSARHAPGAGCTWLSALSGRRSRWRWPTTARAQQPWAAAASGS